MFDGGIMRGSDIVAALCLGADFAFIGRAALYAVAAHGQAGVARAIAILQQEIHLAMATMGCVSVGELDASYLQGGRKA
jgi:L-lactate dehydrogenase (cytochrome)/(S)-mandelate dehydrogenase